jgi:hypothetical protein
MADRSLRGTGITYRSMETELGVEFAARIEAVYDCPAGHTLVVPFAAEADVPTQWGCRCGTEALARNHTQELPPEPRRGRTHWEMLLERRSIAELEDLLAERLEKLRAARQVSRVR